jgi:beta-galactosidase/beta-glucuronidase
MIEQNIFSALDRKSKEKENMRIIKEHMKETLEHLQNHPSIVAYTIFNEGWGQFNSDEMYELAKSIDGSRLYDSTSGWFAQNKNDFDSEHIYFKTTSPEVKERPMFVSECGGYSQVIDGHFYSKYGAYGYGGAKDAEELTNMICKMYEEMILPGLDAGICGCVYTQLSDVEDEVNGLYTYDRKICKVNKEKMQKLSQQIYSHF